MVIPLGVIVNVLLYMVLWGRRFYYDDEWFNLKLAANYDVRGLLDYIINFDIHPPLSYLINYYWLKVGGADEFIMSVPSLLFSALTAAIAANLAYDITGKRRMGYVAFALVLLHPNLQLFGWSIRWYPLWTFAAMGSLYCLLKAWNKSRPVKESILLCVFLTLGLYTNYQSFLLLGAIVSSLLFRVIQRLRRGEGMLSTIYVLGSVLAAVVLFLPYVRIFLSDLNIFFGWNQVQYKDYYQAVSSVLYGFYTLFTIVFGAAIYPWNVEFIVFGVAFLMVVSFIAIIGLRTIGGNGSLVSHSLYNRQLFADFDLISVALLLIFLINSVLTGSHKARGLVLLSILCVIMIVIWVDRLIDNRRNRVFNGLVMVIPIIYAAVLIVGVVNIYQRKHLHKMAYADPVSDVLNRVEEICAASDLDVVLITIHPSISYYSMWWDSEKYAVISPYVVAVPRFIPIEDELQYIRRIDEYPYKGVRVIIIDSFLGPFLSMEDRYYAVLKGIRDCGERVQSTEKYCRDEDFSFKSRFFPGSGIREWRFALEVYDMQEGLSSEVVRQIVAMSKIWAITSDVFKKNE